MEKVDKLRKALLAVSHEVHKFLLEDCSDLDALNVMDLAKLQGSLKANIDILDSQVKPLKGVYDIIRKGKLPDAMAEEGIRGISVEGTGNVSLTSSVYANVKKENEEAFILWLKDHGHGELVKETIHHSTLRALMEQKYKDGEAIPEYLVNVSPYSYAKITKIKKADIQTL